MENDLLEVTLAGTSIGESVDVNSIKRLWALAMITPAQRVVSVIGIGHQDITNSAPGTQHP